MKVLAKLVFGTLGCVLLISGIAVKVQEIRTLRSTWRGLETWHGIGLKPARQSSTLPASARRCDSAGRLT